MDLTEEQETLYLYFKERMMNELLNKMASMVYRSDTGCCEKFNYYGYGRTIEDSDNHSSRCAVHIISRAIKEVRDAEE